MGDTTTPLAPPPPQALAGPVPDLLQHLGTGADGLSAAAATARLARYGANRLAEPPKPRILWRLLANFTHMMALLLWGGGIVALLGGMPQLAIAIWAVNLINGAFSFWQEWRAERATEALQRMIPAVARVCRDGQEQRIPADTLVPGDILLLGEGDRLSADARVIEAADLYVDQSVLTGESRPVPKQVDPAPTAASPAETAHCVYAGTSVSSGDGRAVVYATGMATEFGRIAGLTQGVKALPSPLQRELIRLTRTVTLLAVGIGLAFFLLATLQGGTSMTENVLFGLGMIVAFVPEGMLPTVTLSLAMAVQRMARRQALVKQLASIETLGCATVICTDKTGTLTQNQMTVHDLWTADGGWSVGGGGYDPTGDIVRSAGSTADREDLIILLRVFALCNNAGLRPPNTETPHWQVTGDPTEAALLVATRKDGLDPDRLAHDWPRLREIPFDAHRKRMTTLHVAHVGDRAERWAMVKGAPAELLARCTHLRRQGTDVPLDDAGRAGILAANDGYAEGGMRVLGAALRRLPADATTAAADILERDLVFVGLAAMLDPPRPGVTEAVADCHRAGIRIVMVTGDYGLTAAGIGRRIGLVPEGPPRTVSGAALDAMDDASLAETVTSTAIFSRLSPEHKLRVVTALQAAGEVVAVTGDGVNDAPALKQADIGVAMGRSGTDVAREAADMILADDHFATIVHAIEEGRAVYANIRRFAIYVFNSNMAEAVPFVAMLFSRGAIPLPLTIMQVLAIDLGTDMLPAIGLGAEAPQRGIMALPPRTRSEPLLTGRVLARALLWYGLLEAAIGMAGYFWLNARHGWPGTPLAPVGSPVYRMATTMTLAAIVMAQVGAVFACRTDRQSVFGIGLLKNRLLLTGVLLEILILIGLVHVPGLQTVFQTAALDGWDWLAVTAAAPALLLLDEGRKAWLRHREAAR
jgi:magnesium-transporting ATPase (P-type)